MFCQVCTDSDAFSDFSAPLFFFSHPDNKTDVFMGGDIDVSIRFVVFDNEYYNGITQILNEMSKITLIVITIKELMIVKDWHYLSQFYVILKSIISLIHRKLAVELGWWDELKDMAGVEEAQFEEVPAEEAKP